MLRGASSRRSFTATMLREYNKAADQLQVFGVAHVAKRYVH
jgi:hypothetical protein